MSNTNAVRHNYTFGVLKIKDDGQIFVLGVLFRKCVLLDGLAKGLRQIVEITTCLDLIDSIMVLPISSCKFDATKKPYALKHVPGLF